MIPPDEDIKKQPPNIIDEEEKDYEGVGEDIEEPTGFPSKYDDGRGEEVN